MTSNYRSWGGYPQTSQTGIPVRWRNEVFPQRRDVSSFLPYGQGRSYGDCCLNDGGAVLDMRALDRFISFDTSTGILRAESGTPLHEILRITVPQGWFLPVTPGTKFVSLGGAVANDVHGKNHHQAGTFGHYVRAFELLRSTGERLVCTAQQNAGFFKATIAGLGLTGLITWVEIQLIRIQGPWMDIEILKFRNLEEFLALTIDSDKDFAYTVSWLDATSGAKGGRGIFMRGNHSARLDSAEAAKEPRVAIPVTPPAHLLNGWTMSLFNKAYYHKQGNSPTRQTVHYDTFFYPLDSVANWNRLYGQAGFTQFQCVIPGSGNETLQTITQLLLTAANVGQISFLTVLKRFGDRPSAGMLSFPRPGITLCLDFPIRGQKTFSLLRALDTIVREKQGAVYPAKDAGMASSSFQQYFPEWKAFSAFKDPQFSSSFWRRVTA